ncbi:rhodanese-like domain-containing protein [Brevibacillus agri]|uniref:Rhodanese-like domain-containing protein n=1 Tax=Brevibacillus gelatini TaxID=1655277 RepID=A0A3M8B3P3_9BACL|nr:MULTISPECIES: rhodanese-like domain-containing protein [Brevibacillus]MCG5254644.1 rhodanese-like domain-containing protein [Brevibacillus agri]MED4569585.1 rhodanese-like domain-containing protein [Brevibacillus agri]RNB57922.1 rhodanese-like domain-containing protein [Brevibacillus gelatini]
MKKVWLVSLVALVAAVSIFVMYLFNMQEKTLQVISSETLTEMLEKKMDMVIVDLREPELFAKGRIPTAINIPFVDIKTKYTSIPKDKKIVFVCHTGRMGTESGNFLLQNGYKDVYNLEGGMAKWKGQIEQ